MLSLQKPVRGCGAKKKKLLDGTLEKMDRAEVTARILGIERGAITRLRGEGLRDLNRQISS